MNANNLRIRFLTRILFILTLCPSLAQTVEAQDFQPSIRQKVIFLPAYRQCHPAEVKGFAFGNQPREVLLAHVIVGNRSDKVINAVKLGWKVYSYTDGSRVANSPCDAPPSSVKLLLSGNTQLVQLAVLAPNETCNISTNPLILPVRATKTVFIDRPFLTEDDFKSLMVGGTRQPEKYMVVMYVSEIHYDAGPIWLAEDIR